MRNAYFILLFLITLSCEKAFLEPEPSTDIEATFETFWTLVDENYCFFDEKQVDWDKLYTINKNKLNNERTKEFQLKFILEDMLNELRDGHVNLHTEEGRSRYNYQEGFADNFDWELLYNNYLKDNLFYEKEESFHSAFIDSVLYLYIGGFGSPTINGETTLSPITIEEQFDRLLAQYPTAKGLVIDVRHNGGGNTDNPDAILSRLITERTLTHYLRPKNGPAHDDFSEAAPFYLEPRAPYYEKHVALLTNRSSYSATNYFAATMKAIPENVTILGDKTGGGAGLPIHKDLPNGWLIRLSTVQLLSNTMQQIEEGIDPDIVVNMLEEDKAVGKDTILETALALFR